MPEVTEVEVKVDENYIYTYCNICFPQIPDFIIDTKRVVKISDPDAKCDGCGKVLVDNAEA